MNPAERFRRNHPTTPTYGSGYQPPPKPTLSTFKKIKIALTLRTQMNNISFASWKTILAGAITAASAVVPMIWPQYTDAMHKLAELAIAFGLMSARQNNVTSEQAGVK